MQTLFYEAVAKGDVEKVKLLLTDSSVNPAARKNWPIQEASKNGHVEIVKLLLDDPRVNPAARGNWAFHLACCYGHIKIVKLLLDDPRIDHIDCLNLAVVLASDQNFVEIVRLLLTNKRVNPKGEEGFRIVYTKAVTDIVAIDDIVIGVRNENVDHLNDDIREKYLLWLYRIGGDKYNIAKNNFMKNEI